MSYNGEPITFCSGNMNIDPKSVRIVWVPGSTLNKCGHVLLKFSGRVKGVYGDHYFHIPGGASGIYDHPYYLDSAGFATYIRSHNKDSERITDYKIEIPNTKNNTKKMEAKLCDLVKKPYLWAMIVHNCQSFVEEIIRAGGAKFFDITKSECPAIDLPMHERIKSITDNGRKLKSVQFIDYVFSY